MLSKEEIEKVNKILSCDNCPTSYACEGCDITWTDKQLLKKYIAQLEREKQKLIEILEKANEEDTESVKRYEKMRRNAISEYYKKSYQTSIHKLNAKRETRRSILKIMKGEK